GGVSALAIAPLTILGVTVEFTSYYIDGWLAWALPSGVIQSTDGGANWNPAGLTGVGTVLTLAIDPLIPTILYAGTGTSGVYKSTNSGVSWNPTGLITWSHISSVSLNPTSVLGGNPSTGTVTLNAAAPAGGAVVALGSSNTSVATAPTSVTVAAGV